VSAPVLPGVAKAKLSVVKGLRAGKTYGLKEGVTYIGRMGPQQVDVDLTEQENPGVSVQVNRFALVWFDKNGLGIADTGTRIGTTVNGKKIPAKQRIPLKAEDTLQFGKTVLQVKVLKKAKTGIQK
jgi:pSer/pThr/pTyr-binding forkhead associated (FHA) protein